MEEKEDPAQRLLRYKKEFPSEDVVWHFCSIGDLEVVELLLEEDLPKRDKYSMDSWNKGYCSVIIIILWRIYRGL